MKNLMILASLLTSLSLQARISSGPIMERNLKCSVTNGIPTVSFVSDLKVTTLLGEVKTADLVINNIGKKSVTVSLVKESSNAYLTVFKTSNNQTTVKVEKNAQTKKLSAEIENYGMFNFSCHE